MNLKNIFVDLCKESSGKKIKESLQCHWKNISEGKFEDPDHLKLRVQHPLSKKSQKNSLLSFSNLCHTFKISLFMFSLRKMLI